MAWAQNGHNSVFVPENAGRGSDKTIFYDNEGKPLTTNDKVEVSFEVGKASIYPVEVRIDKLNNTTNPKHLSVIVDAGVCAPSGLVAGRLITG